MTGYTKFPKSEWDPAFSKFLDEETNFLPREWHRFVQMAGPPPDDGAECAAVTTRAVDRASRLGEIKDQDSGVEGALWPLIETFGVQNVAPANWTTTFKETWSVLLAATFDLRPGLFRLKDHFNRGRPVHVPCANLGQLPFPSPGHPAYPGGHAAQAWMAFFLLRDALGVQERYWSSLARAAERVADNRVVAGIHFPSDTDAGKALAEQFVGMLRGVTAFGALCVKARAELKALGLT